MIQCVQINKYRIPGEEGYLMEKQTVNNALIFLVKVVKFIPVSRGKLN